MGEPTTVGGRQRIGHLADQLVGLVVVERPIREDLVQAGGVGKPLPHDVEELAVLDGVEDLDETRVSEESGLAGSCQDPLGALVSGGHEVDPDGAAELLVDGPPAGEVSRLGDALVQAVTTGDAISAVALRS
ncbi:hypothetical protein ACFQZC_19380 [Streptacidiphilus monticola]